MRNAHRHLIAIILSASALVGCSREARSRERLDRATTALSAGRYDEAEIEYKNALQLNPQNADAYRRLGALYQEQGRVAAAVGYLTQAKQLEPNNVDGRVKLGIALLAAGQGTSARDEAVFVLAQRPADAEAPLLLAETARSPKEIADVRQRLAALSADIRASAPVLVALGQLEVRAGRLSEADKCFKQAVAVDAKSANAHLGLAMLAAAHNDTKTAEAEFKAAADNSPIRSPRRLQYVRFKLQSGDAAGARALLAEMTRTAPDYIPPWLWLADIALTEKKYDEAETCVSKALARDGMNPEAMLLNGRVRLARGEFDNAIIALESMVNTFPNAAIAHHNLGIARDAKGERAKARESFARAVALSPDYVPAVMALGELNLRLGDYAGAVATLAPFAQKHPEVPPVRLMLAEAYRAQGSLDSALTVITELEKQYPTNPQTAFLRGSILRQQGKADNAREEFNRASALAPAAYAALESAVDIDLSQKKFQEAQVRATAAVERNPKAGEPLVVLAKVHLARNDAAAAEDALKRATTLEPSLSAPYQLLARLYIATKQYPRAIDNLREVIAKNPKDVAALTQLAVLLDAQGDADAARMAYEKLLEAAPNNVVALNNLAFFYAERLNQLDRATDLAQRARSLAPDDPRVSDTLGWIQYRRGQYPQALPLLQESVAKLPNEQDPNVHLAMTLYMLVQENVARVAFQQLVQRWPALAESPEIKMRIALLAIDPAKGADGDRALVERVTTQNPNDPVAWSRLASFFESRKDSAKARAAAESALRASPGSAVVLTQLARICSAQGERDQALAYAKDARAAAPDAVEPTHLLGTLAGAAGQHRWAASLLREAADRQPDNPELLYDWALAAYSIGEVSDATTGAQQALKHGASFVRAEQARRFLELAAVSPESVQGSDEQRIRGFIAADPDCVPALMAGAALSEAHKDWRAAQQAYEKALTTYPDFGPAQKALAVRYAAANESSATALALATKARQTYPTDPDVAKALGILAYRKGEYSRAQSVLQESALARPSDAELMCYLGLSQLKAGQATNGRKSLESALQLGVGGDLQTEARRALASQK